MTKLKDHCKHGHPLSGTNIRIKKKAKRLTDGSTKVYESRLCLACRRADNRIYRTRIKLKARGVDAAYMAYTKKETI